MMNASVITEEDLQNARVALDRPIHLAEGIPGSFYGDSFYALEREKLFPSTWCVVTVGSVIPEVGDMIPIDLAGWPILLVRGREGEIRAFHNICRHRALQLVASPCKASLIRCPWHSWSYNLEGALMATPEIAGARLNAAEGFDRAELGLKQIPVGRWLDYVFVNLDGAAAPFEQHIAPLVELVKSLDLGDLRHGGRIDEVYRGNWKLSTEGGIEDYHLPFGHPQLDAGAYRNTTPCFSDGVYTGGWVDMSLPAGAQTGVAKPGALPALRTDNGLRSDRLLVLNVFPTGTVLIEADHVMIGILLPDGAASTKVELHFYYDGEAATSPAHEAARARRIAMWQEVLPQDFPFIERSQATIHARDGAGIRTRFSPYWEQAVFHFQRMVVDAVS